MKFLKFKMHKASWVILVSFLVLAFLDFYSTFHAGDLAHYLETNPLYPYIGFSGIIGLNLLVLYLLLKSYDAGSIFTRYANCSVITYFSAIRASVVYNNFNVAHKVVEQIQSGELTKEAIQGVSQAAKTASYISYMSIVAYGVIASLLLSFIIYYIFILDHKIVKA